MRDSQKYLYCNNTKDLKRSSGSQDKGAVSFGHEPQSNSKDKHNQVST